MERGVEVPLTLSPRPLAPLPFDCGILLLPQIPSCNMSGDFRDISFDRCGSYGDAGTFYAKSHALNVSNLTVLEPRSVDFDIISEGAGPSCSEGRPHLLVFVSYICPNRSC